MLARAETRSTRLVVEAHPRGENVLHTGEAIDAFQQLIAAQGGLADFTQRSGQYLGAAPVTLDVTPDNDGYIAAIDTRKIGNIVVGLGGGRTVPGEVIDNGVGLSHCRGIGDQVGPSSPICRVHAASSGEVAEAAKRVL